VKQRQSSAGLTDRQGERIAKRACAKIASYGDETNDDTHDERSGANLLELLEAF
jgi:hypothetical protein